MAARVFRLLPAPPYRSGMAPSTHTVTNQAPPLVGYDVYTSDQALTEGVERHVAPELLDGVREDLSLLGRTAGSAQAQEWGVQANENPPKLRTHDRYGNRIDEVDFHPAWHRLLGKAVSSGLTNAWGGRRGMCAGRPGSWCGRRPRPGTAARCR